MIAITFIGYLKQRQSGAFLCEQCGAGAGLVSWHIVIILATAKDGQWWCRQIWHSVQFSDF